MEARGEAAPYCVRGDVVLLTGEGRELCTLTTDSFESRRRLCSCLSLRCLWRWCLSLLCLCRL